jgi:hypothetical protein
MMKNPTSLIKVFFPTLNSRTIAIDPATTVVINTAAPINSPTARLPLCELIAANVEKTSGLPFPNARKVTPAMLSLIPRIDAIVLRLGQKNSEAAIPIVENKSASHSERIIKAPGCAFGRLQ